MSDSRTHREAPRELEVVALRARAVAQRRRSRTRRRCPRGGGATSGRPSIVEPRVLVGAARASRSNAAASAASAAAPAGRGSVSHLLQRAQPVVDAAVDLDDVEPLLEQRDRRQEALALQAVRAERRRAGSSTSSRTPRRARTARSAGGRGSSRRRCRTRGIRRSRSGASGARCARRPSRADPPRASSVAQLACTSRMNAWKCTRVLRRIGTAAKKRPSGSSCRGRRRPTGRRRAARPAARTARFSVERRAARNAASSSASRCSRSSARVCAWSRTIAARRRAAARGTR